jgi:hypothetical protein
MSKKSQSTHCMCRKQCLLRYGRYSCDICSRCSVCFPCISSQLSARRRTEFRTLSNIHGFTQIFRQSFSTLCCYTSKISHWSALNALKPLCPYSKYSKGLRSGDRAGHLTVSPRPIHCSPKTRFRCFLSVEKMRWCPIMPEPHALLLIMGHMLQECW